SMQEAQHAPQTAPVLTVGDLQRVLQIGRRKGYDLVEDGGIPHSRGGNRIRFTPEQVNEYLSSRTIPMRVTTQTSDSGDTPSRG
ncbi:MAG TPA: helix-turn-helix domain-containing protein, partial [Candidatus Saccharimonadales bacterium]|nr:helix-turn-helix domain-containing protein [Candidatus Saccharimonadales bacterium]